MSQISTDWGTKTKTIARRRGPLPSATTPSQKRPRASPLGSTLENIIGEDEINPVEYWTEESRWPKEYFELDKSFPWEQSETSSSAPSYAVPTYTTASDQKPREAKSSPYMDPRYETVLAIKGSFMDNFELGITDESKELCQTLLEAEQSMQIPCFVTIFSRELARINE